MHLGVYIYGANIQAQKHNEDKDKAIEELIANAPSNFDSSEDDILLFQFKEGNSEGEIVFNYAQDHLEEGM